MRFMKVVRADKLGCYKESNRLIWNTLYLKKLIMIWLQQLHQSYINSYRLASVSVNCVWLDDTSLAIDVSMTAPWHSGHAPQILQLHLIVQSLLVTVEHLPLHSTKNGQQTVGFWGCQVTMVLRVWCDFGNNEHNFRAFGTSRNSTLWSRTWREQLENQDFMP